MGGRQVQVPSWSDQLQREGDAERAKREARLEPMPSEFAKLLKLDHQPLWDPEHPGKWGDMINKAAAAQAAPDAPSIKATHIVGDDSGNQTAVQIWDDGSVRKVSLGGIGKSNKFDPANAAASAQNGATRALTENQRAESANKALKDYQTLLDQKNKIEAENRNIDIALQSGRHYVDKEGHLTAFDKGGQAIAEEDRAGYQQAMQAKKKANMERLPQVISDMQGAQNRYADLSGNQGARPTGGAQQSSAPAPAPAAPAPQQQPKAAGKGGAPAAEKTPAKKATMANIQAYATKKKITPKQAQQEFESAGYQVTQ